MGGAHPKRTTLHDDGGDIVSVIEEGFLDDGDLGDGVPYQATYLVPRYVVARAIFGRWSDWSGRTVKAVELEE